MEYKTIKFLFKSIECISIFSFIISIVNYLYPELNAKELISLSSKIVILFFILIIYLCIKYVINKIDLATKDLTENEIEAIKKIRKLGVGEHTIVVTRDEKTKQ